MLRTIQPAPVIAGPVVGDKSSAPASFRRLPALAVFAVILAGTGSAAVAADRLQEARARYQQDRTACMSGQSHQDRATCLREAGAALQEARRGQMADQSPYEQNLLLRCERVADADREDCQRRMRGEGTVSGSVESGGIFREYRRTVPAQ